MSRTRPTPTNPVSTLGFVLIVLAVIAVGLTGVLVTTTSIGAQSKELTELRAEADRLEYESAALGSEIETRASTSSLALRAADLGMVPNPYPAYVMLGTGEILGEPTKVTGREFPQLRRPQPKPSNPSPSPSPVVTPAPVPPAPDASPTPRSPDDVVAADRPGQASTPAPSAAPTPSTTAEPTPAPSQTPTEGARG